MMYIKPCHQCGRLIYSDETDSYKMKDNHLYCFRCANLSYKPPQYQLIFCDMCHIAIVEEERHLYQQDDEVVICASCAGLNPAARTLEELFRRISMKTILVPHEFVLDRINEYLQYVDLKDIDINQTAHNIVRTYYEQYKDRLN